MAQAPNVYNRIVELANKYPKEFREAHRPELGQEKAERWIRLAAFELNQEDRGWGLNGKRGDRNVISQDGLCYLGAGPGHDPQYDNKPITFVDVIGGAGGSNPTPAWQPYEGSGPGAWIQPRPVPGYHDNPTPAPTPTPPPVEVPTNVENAITNLIKALVAHADQIGSLQKKDAESRKLFLDGLEQQFVRFNQTMDRVIASADAEMASDAALKASLDGLEQRLVKGWSVNLKGGWPVGNINGDVSAK